MKKYEVVREIFNSCKGNQMRDVDMQEVMAEDPEEVMAKYRIGKDIEESKTVMSNGDVIYNITIDGLSQRFSFTEI